jgi:ATP-dependent DNA helicase RecG
VAGRRLRQLSELPVGLLAGVGAKREAALGDWGVHSVLDLLTTYPRRYIDRSRQADLAGLAVGEEAVVLAEVRDTRSRRTRNGRTIVELRVHDGTGGMTVVFFNQPWRTRQLAAGSEALFFGKLEEYRGGRQMTNPVVDLVVGVEGRDGGRDRTGRVVPVYPASAKAGLTSWELGTWVGEALERAGRLADPVPGHWRDRLSLEDRTAAVRAIHLPDATADVAPARRRLAFDELFRLQMALVLRRRVLERTARAIRHAVSPTELVPSRPADAAEPPTLVRSLIEGLPYELTAAQRKALAVVFADLAGPLPMHRLLQGDVGSGKTVVAVATMVAAVQGGHQAALMVPTEVLAEQHLMSVRELLEGLTLVDPARLGGRRPVTVALLTNRTSAKERARLRLGLLDGSVDVVVGTHALLTDDVEFSSLGVVVIDEQHRFGVEQRAALREKGRAEGSEGNDPDLLVMTATPIPRTAAMVVFGDLDLTVLDELPPGRQPVRTHWARTPEAVASAWAQVRHEVGAGHRVFVVCPLVEGSERVVARSAVDELERLGSGVLAGLRLGLLHGQMAPADKEAAMASFRSGEIEVLVATTVVEVGVDVPEATVMVVLDADRFGIAQLHQLRGRVGRGGHPSWCYLLAEGSTPGAAERLEALEATSDGFELAEVDLRLRGQGTILGARQKGRSDLKLASLLRDRELLDAARAVAEDLTAGDPQLEGHPVLADEIRLFLSDEEAEYLFRS